MLAFLEFFHDESNNDGRIRLFCIDFEAIRFSQVYRITHVIAMALLGARMTTSRTGRRPEASASKASKRSKG